MVELIYKSLAKFIMENSQKKCPECDSYSLIPFVYGHMSEEARIKRGKKGEYAWGGCRLTGATDYCKECEASFIVSSTSIEKIESETFDEGSFLKDRGNLFRSIDKYLDEDKDKELYAQALNEADGDKVEAEHIYYSLFIQSNSDED